MKKKNQIWMKGISVVLAVVVAATTVLHIDERLLARETFSGLKSILANNEQLTIVEIVDDFSESSMGYLFGDLEPYDVEQAKRDGEMDDLLDDLLGRGLLTMGDTDDWSSYPLHYEILETAYSDYAGDEKILIDREGFRQQGSTAAELSGYYVPITELHEDDSTTAFYRCKKEDYEKMQFMMPEELRNAAEEIKQSYALALDENGDAINPKGYPDGYTIDLSDEHDYQYFRFVLEEPEATIETQSVFDMSVYAGNSSVGAMYGLRVTEVASMKDAAPTPPEGSALTELDVEGETPSDGDNDPMIAPTPEQTSDDVTPPDTTETDDVADPNGEETDAGVAPEGDRAGQPDNAGQSISGDDLSSGNAGSEEEIQGVTEGETQEETQEVPEEGTEVSAVIYVQFDENHSVLVASLGNAGIVDVVDASNLDVHHEESDDAETPSGGSDTGIVNGAIPTIPAQEDDSGTTNSDNNSWTSNTVGGGTPVEGGGETPVEGGGETPAEGGGETPAEGGGETPAEGGGETPAEGGDETPAEGGDETPAEGGDETPVEGGDEDNDGGDADAEGDGDAVTEGDAEAGEDENDEEYTVTYHWEGLNHEIGNFTEPELPDGGPVKNIKEFTRPDRPENIKVFDFDDEEVQIGTYVFEDWGDLVEVTEDTEGIEGAEEGSEGAADDTDTPVEEGKKTKTFTVAGTWRYEPESASGYRITYEWKLIGEEGSLPEGLTADNMVLKIKSSIQTFGMSEQSEEIELPKEEQVQEDLPYTLPDFVGAAFEVYDTDGNYYGMATFERWENSAGEPLEGDIDLNEDTTVVGVLSGDFYILENPIGDFQWLVIGDDKEGNPIWEENYTFPEDLPVGSYLPDGVTFPIDVHLINIPRSPEAIEGEDGTCYMLDPDSREVEVCAANGRTVGKYRFEGWATLDENNKLVFLDPDEGFIIDDDGITLYGVWSYVSVETKISIPGGGYAYVYVNDTIHNNDWFRYYVLGLEEKEFGKCNIQIVTYLADGSDKRMAGYGPLGSDCSLNDAIKKADLIYLNTNGVWLDDKGDVVSSDRRFSTENAKTLLERACNLNRSERMAVILDSSVRNNQVDENIQKVTTILCQEDIAEAYASLSEEGMSYEKAFSSSEWQQLNYYAGEAIRNSGNFVRDNIYCVSHSRGEFRNSTYPEGESVVRPGSMPALANADFENRFTDTVTDAGFAEVYQAIQKENYERAHSGGAYTSLDEYVIPATAVAYILNYRDYDPIIYKDKIRVLELEPCRDYTYYYDGQSGTTEFELKMKFARDWAQDFIAKLNADPDAITIDGMTTSEFCGKILDIYEEYDVIYFGSNDGVLNRRNEPEGWRWVKMDSYDGGMITADNPYQPKSWEQIYYTYRDGKWYKLERTGRQELVESEGPNWEAWGGWDGSANWKWNNNEKAWYKESGATGWGNWQKTQESPGFDVNADRYVYNHYAKRWYEYKDVYGEGEQIDPPKDGQTYWYSASGAQDSLWMWKPNDWDNQWIETGNGDQKQKLQAQGWYKKEYMEAVTYVSYNDSGMNGMLYTHIGDYMWGAWDGYNGHLADNGDAVYGYRSSGNDILKSQVEELNDYLNGGSLIILSSDFITTDQNHKKVINSSNISHRIGEYSYYGILDTSSYVYQFVAGAFEKDAEGNDVPKYSNLIVEDYGNGDLKDTEAFVEALNLQKVVLNLYSAPDAYDYQEEGTLGTIGDRTLLQKEADGRYYLNYEFIIGNLSSVAPMTTRYDVKLFLDSNSDGIYNMATEELPDVTVINAQTGEVLNQSGGSYQLQANIPYRVRRELPDGYVGCIGWKLMVTQNGNTHIHDSVTGLTAVPVQPGYSDEVDPLTGKKVIHVLQIVPQAGVTINLEELTEHPSEGEEWNELLECLPDFKIDFDSITNVDFAKNWTEGWNGGVDGVLQSSVARWEDTKDPVTGRRNNYLNLYRYDMVVVGFQDAYPSVPSQVAVDAILRFADTGKSVLFTHDTTYSGGWEHAPDDFTYDGQLGQSFSMKIRELCGMDRFGISVDWYTEDGANSNREGSPLRTPGREPQAWAMTYNEANPVYQWNEAHDGNHTRDVAYAPNTNQTVMAAQTQGLVWSMVNNVYDNMFDWSSHGASKPNQSHWLQDYSGQECEVSQVNSGIITQYPYDIPETMPIAFTHAQYYQLDLDTDRDGDGRGDVVCWYAIKSRNEGDWNDAYDFSPNDVRNNYYIYNKGNITYSGVGHTSDPSALTTEEKKLFINTFIAAYSAGIRNPSVRIVENGSVNAPDLESVSIPFNGVDEATAGTYRVYYQVKDNNITQGTRNLSVKYYFGNPAGSGEVIYRTETISADLFADGELKTYSADTGLEVSFDAVRSGHSYYVDIPLTRLLNNETFDFYVEVDLAMADDPSRVVAFDVDKLTIAKLKMFSLD